AEEGPADRPPLSLEELRSRERPAAWEADPRPGPEAEALAAAETVEIRAALRALDARARRVVWLHFWERRPLSEIARQLGMSKPSVHALERRAFRQMRE